MDMVLPRNTTTNRLMAVGGILMPVGTLMMAIALARKIDIIYNLSD
jgi:hypothetical protein